VTQLREWIGQRQITGLIAPRHSSCFTIGNRKFESPGDTLSRSRVTTSPTTSLGSSPRRFSSWAGTPRRMFLPHPDELVFDLLAQGFTTRCVDGQSVFDTDDPQRDCS